MKEARKIGRHLVTHKLVACVNMIPVTSCYSWKKKIVVEEEVLMIMKTRSEVFEELKRQISAIHSYEVPEIVSFRIDKGLRKYMDWIDDCVVSR